MECLVETQEVALDHACEQRIQHALYTLHPALYAATRAILHRIGVQIAKCSVHDAECRVQPAESRVQSLKSADSSAAAVPVSDPFRDPGVQTDAGGTKWKEDTV